MFFFAAANLLYLKMQISDYVTKNLIKNVLKYIFQSQVDCCLPAHEPAAAAAAAAAVSARQPTFTSEAEERRAD